VKTRRARRHSSPLDVFNHVERAVEHGAGLRANHHTRERRCGVSRARA
jgi:hypothetical protein